MAARDQADVLALLQAVRDLRDDLRSEIPGFLTLIAAIRVQAIVDDDVEENSELLDWCDDMEDLCDALWNGQQGSAVPLAKVLGRYASSPDLNDYDRNLAEFQDKLVADSDEFKLRGFTKFSAWSAGGSNTGNGTAMVHNIDPAYGGDISHVETLTAECRTAEVGSQAVFRITGEKAGDFAYLEGGSGIGNAYGMPTAGVGAQSPGVGQEELQTGEDISSVGDESSEGNLIEDGGFEAATLDSNDSNWVDNSGSPAINTSSPISGTQDLIFDNANGEVYQDVSNVVEAGKYYGLEFWTKKVGTVSAGTTVVKLSDDTTDHITLTVTNNGASGTEKKAYGTVRIPDSADLANMKIYVTEASIAGGGSMQVDMIKLVPLKVIDGGRAVGFTDGTTAWVRNDVFTGATSGGTGGTLQRQNNELFGRGFEADSTATDWADS
jgi:hypothetical protein